MSCCENHPGDTAQRLIERLLEDEALTSGLVDAAAATLLEWGKTQVEALVWQAEDRRQKELDRDFTELRHTMRHISEQAGETTPEMQIERVRALLEAQVKTGVEATSEHSIKSTTEEEDYAA